MDVQACSFTINSANPDALHAFYREIVGLKPLPERGERVFNLNGASFGIDGHDAISGPSNEPARSLLNFFVADAKVECERMETLGVDFIRKEGVEFWGGVISTFADLDGNLCQLIQYDPSRARAEG